MSFFASSCGPTSSRHFKPDELHLQVVVGHAPFLELGIPPDVERLGLADAFFERRAKRPAAVLSHPATIDLIEEFGAVEVDERRVGHR